MDSKVEQFGCRSIVRFRHSEGRSVREDSPGRTGDDPWITKRLEVDDLCALDLNVTPKASSGSSRLEGNRGDAHPLAELGRLLVDRHQAHCVRWHVDESSDVALAVPQYFPVGIARDLEILPRATPQIHEGVVEAAKAEEGLKSRLFYAGELSSLRESRRDFFVGRSGRHASGEGTGLASCLPLEHHRVSHVSLSILTSEIYCWLESVAEAINVGRVGIDILAQRVRMLDDAAEELWIIGRLKRARVGKRTCVFVAATLAHWIINARAHDERLDEGLTVCLDFADSLSCRHVGFST